MYLLGNLIWVICGGFAAAILWFAAGILCCITIYGIPFGIQCFKMSSFVFWPFGKRIDIGSFGFGGLLGNFIWILILGWELFFIHLALGLVMCITIVGIPFGLQHFKLAKLAILPFGAKIYK